MKIYVLLVICLFFGAVSAQEEFGFFEQKAFEFYKDSLVTKYPPEKRLRVAKYLVDLYPDWTGIYIDHCLSYDTDELELLDGYNMYSVDFNAYFKEIDRTDLPKNFFRLKKRKVNSLPNLKISKPYYIRENSSEIYLIINENYYDKSVDYYFLFNEKGDIKNWCRSESIITHQ